MLRRTTTIFVTLALTACAPRVYKNTVYVPPAVSHEIKTVSIEVSWPEAAPDFHGYARSRGQAAGEGAGSVAGEGKPAADICRVSAGSAHPLVGPLGAPCSVCGVAWLG